MRLYTMTDPTDGHTVIYDGPTPWETLINGAYPTVVSFDDNDAAHEHTFSGTGFVFGDDEEHFTFVNTGSKYASEFDFMIEQIVEGVSDTYPRVFPIDMGLTPFIMVPVGPDRWVLIDDDRNGELDIKAIYVWACTGYKPGFGDLDVVGKPVIVTDSHTTSDFVRAIQTCVKNNGWDN